MPLSSRLLKIMVARVEIAPVVSVIVPVYNVRKYLSRCIDSIIAQDYYDFELLLVDDGSTDGSGNICDSYAGQDARIYVVHKQNGCVSSARNFGLDKARGKWVAFVDVDDYVERSYLSSLLDDLGITADTDCVFHTGTAALASSHIKSRELFGSCRVYDRAQFGYMFAGFPTVFRWSAGCQTVRKIYYMRERYQVS